MCTYVSDDTTVSIFFLNFIRQSTALEKDVT